MINFNPELICIDLDGTLLWKYHIILPQNIIALKKAHAHNLNYTFVSGRDVPGILPFVKIAKMPISKSYIVALNGTKIYDLENKKIVRSHTIPGSEMKEVIDFLLARKFIIISYISGEVISMTEGYLMNKFSKRILDKVKKIHSVDEYYVDTYKMFAIWLPGIFRKKKAIKKIDKFIHNFNDKFEIVRTSNFSFEITKKGISKGTGIKELSKLMNIKTSKMAAIGDSGNDIPAFKEVGYSYAMPKAMKMTKSSASEIIERQHSKNGVAKVIDDLIKLKESRANKKRMNDE